MDNTLPKEPLKENNWFKTKQIETWVGDQETGARKQLIVLHQCGDDKDTLISQLKTMIHGIETDFEWFAN